MSAPSLFFGFRIGFDSLTISFSLHLLHSEGLLVFFLLSLG